MSVDEVTQPDHDARPAAAHVAQASERDNWVRWTGVRAGEQPREQPRPEPGHVESHFLKANSPDGTRALWIKHTLLVPVARPEAAVAEVWAVAFAERGARKLAEKRSYRLADVQVRHDPFAIEAPCARFRHGAADGQLGSLGWTLRFACAEQAFRPFPLAAMYTGAFPRSKSLTPAPDTRVHGSFRAFGELWDVAGWHGAQGHNWGKSHAHAYAWAHANSFLDERGEPLSGVWFEALSGRVRLGSRVLTPLLSVAGLWLDDRLFRFDRLRALLARKVAVDTRSYRLELSQGGARLTATLRAQQEQFAGLRYEDPDGRSLACLNSKLAQAELQFTFRGRTRRMYSQQAALEIGTRDGDHGIAMLA